MKGYNKCGIHSRLRNIISKSGGYDRRLGAECLIKEFGITDKYIALELARYSDVRESINKYGLEYVIEFAKKKIINDEVKLSQSVMAINHLFTKF